MTIQSRCWAHMSFAYQYFLQYIVLIKPWSKWLVGLLCLLLSKTTVKYATGAMWQ